MFQAPESDNEPTAGAGFKAPEDDLDPPKSLGGFLSNAAKNAGRFINPLNMAEGVGEQVKKGAFDLPKEATESLAQTVGNVVSGDPTEIEDLPISKEAEDIANSPIVQDPVDYAYKNPVDAAAMAAVPVLGFMGEGAAPIAGKAVEEGLPEAGPMPETPKGLPVIAPGAKEGAPHGLFAYNDDFGPEGAKRSLYNVYGDPNHPAIQKRGWGSSVTEQDLEKAGIPITGRTPSSAPFEPIKASAEAKPPVSGPSAGASPWVYDLFGKGEPPSTAKSAGSSLPKPDFEPSIAPEAKPMPPKEDPFKDVRDYVNSKYEKAAGKQGFTEKVARYLKDEANKLGAKDIGLQTRQIQSMGPGYQGLQKASQLVDYAREKGYLDPGLTDVARRAKVTADMTKSGKTVDAIRNVADQRGAPPVDAIKAAVKQELETKYGPGVENAPREIKNVMIQIEKAPPTFKGMSDLATTLNKAKTKVKDLGQHPGPTTDAANIISRMNNDAIRTHLNPKESQLYTQTLRDYGATKKLEQATAAAGRRDLSARSNQRGILGRLYQEALDRGGYRIGGNVATRVADTILKNPGKIRTLPQFFEELAHHSNDVIDDSLDYPGMAKGGMVPDEVRKYVGC